MHQLQDNRADPRFVQELRIGQKVGGSFLRAPFDMVAPFLTDPLRQHAQMPNNGNSRPTNRKDAPQALLPSLDLYRIRSSFDQ